jgi:hypothetical protein
MEKPMITSKQLSNKKYVNLKLTTNQMMHLGTHLYEYLTEYDVHDKEDQKLNYDFHQVKSLKNIFQRIREISGR